MAANVFRGGIPRPSSTAAAARPTRRRAPRRQLSQRQGQQLDSRVVSSDCRPRQQTASRRLSFVFWRKPGQQVRPVARHDAAYFVVDGADVVESLNLAADHFEFLRAEGATVQEFDWHRVETIKFRPPDIAEFGAEGTHLS